MASHNIASVQTNIITGFLGVGKTSAILHLLKTRPASERWAILVNEFGDIGMDGALIQAQSETNTGVFIREVPGGCMCCAAGVPMQVALNELLKQARPDRLLIEPTGLGHPREVLQVLAGEHYRNVLSLQHTITLVDARKLSDERYTGHDTFNQQIALADVVVGNKVDLYQVEDRQRLADYVSVSAQPGTELVFAEQGRFDAEWLKGPTASPIVQAHHDHHADHRPVSEPAASARFPASGVIKAVNEGEGYVSIGWRITPEQIFDLPSLLRLVERLDVERLKAVFVTNQGLISMNKTPDGLQQETLEASPESRIEVISERIDPTLEQALFACLVQSPEGRS